MNNPLRCNSHKVNIENKSNDKSQYDVDNNYDGIIFECPKIFVCKEPYNEYD